MVVGYFAPLKLLAIICMHKSSVFEGKIPATLGYIQIGYAGCMAAASALWAYSIWRNRSHSSVSCEADTTKA